MSVTSTPALPCGKYPSRGARQPSRATSTVRESRAGFEPAVSMARSIRHLHHQRWLSRVMRGKPNNKLALSRRSCAAIANPLGSALSSVSGSSPRSLRQAPRLWARAIRHEPRDPGLPFRLAPGCSNEPCFGQQKTLRSIWLGRVRSNRTGVSPLMRDRSHEPGVRYRLARSHSLAGGGVRTRST